MAVLRLINATHDTPHTTTHHTTLDDEEAQRQQAQQVFEHWRVLLRHGRVVARVMSGGREACAVGMLRLGFDVEALLLAVEGCAASPFCGGQNRTGQVFDDFEWILANEARVERLAEIGKRARDAFTRQMVAGRGAGDAAACSTPESRRAADAARERLKELREFLSGRRGGR